MKIITNHHVRDILYWEQLTPEEQKEFDYTGMEEDSYFRYKGWTYTLSDFMRISNHPDPEFSAWDGYLSDSFFSGILVKYPVDDGIYGDGIIVGWYIT